MDGEPSPCYSSPIPAKRAEGALGLPRRLESQQPQRCSDSTDQGQHHTRSCSQDACPADRYTFALGYELAVHVDISSSMCSGIYCNASWTSFCTCVKASSSQELQQLLSSQLSIFTGVT